MSVLNIAESAIVAARASISTTGHNIANASTEGYNRQTVIQVSAAGQASGVGYLGKGTQVVTIERAYNEFLAGQLNSSITSKGFHQTYYAQIQQIDNMLGDSDVGLSPTLQHFFNSVQDLSTAETSTGTRQSMLSSAQSLATRFNSINQQLDEMYQGVNNQITTSVGLINTYANELATLNDAIEKAVGRSDGSMPNDLLDQRDLLISKLSEEVQVSVVKQGASYNVFIGSGQPLVVGKNVNDVIAMASSTDPTRLEVAFKNNGATMAMDGNSLGGGNLAGLVNYRTEALDTARNSLGRMATVLASTFNQQHQLGQDLNGNLGGKFFSVADPVVTANSYNASNGSVAATISDATQLTTSDYRVEVTGTGPLAYQVVRLSDGQVTSGSPSTVDGVGFSVTGTHTVNDSFLIKPVSDGAKDISVAINSTNEIATAVPILASASNDNMGTGKASQGVVNPSLPLPANLKNEVTITFTSATTYDVVDETTSTTLATGVTYSPGGDISYNGWTVQISGAPKTDDVFTVAENVGGTGDNRNAELLAKLQTTDLMDGGTSNYQEAYSKLVNFIGNKTGELKVTSAAAEAFYTQNFETQQSESGVNLDEEAADLLRHQQAYQAAAQLMKTAQEMFDLLLSLGG